MRSLLPSSSSNKIQIHPFTFPLILLNNFHTSDFAMDLPHPPPLPSIQLSGATIDSPPPPPSPPPSPPQPLSLISMLDHCKTMKNFKQIHSQIIRSGHASSPAEQRRMVSFCCTPAQADMPYARLLLDAMPNPKDQFIWNTMIKGYSGNISPETAATFYIEMLTRGIRPDDYTYPFLLKSFDRETAVELRDEIHAHVIKFGFRSNPYVLDSLIHAYSFAGAVDSARELFDASSKRNPVAWNAIISAYNRSRKYDESCKLFTEMKKLHVDPTQVTLLLVISACAKLRDLEFGSWIHGIMENSGITPNLSLQNALIDMYASSGDISTAWNLFERMETKDVISWTAIIAGFAKIGKVDLARELFDRMPDRDIISWTALIDGYIKSGRFKEVLAIFRELQAAGETPDEFTIVSVLTACANLGALDLGEWIRTYMDRKQIHVDIFVSNALIDLYSKCGCVENAMEIFDKMRMKDRFTWTAMIAGLAINGSGEKALDLFTRMQAMSVRPDEVTYIGVLSACAHAGFIIEGKEIFKNMINDHRIQPNVTHYGCMVDLLGRAGQIDEALETIVNMPMNPNSRVWGSLIAACRIHRDLAMAEFCANKILDLEPENGAVYVILANIYAKSGRWEEVGRVKEAVMRRGVKKVPGCSLIEMNGEMHEFVAGDRSHEGSDEIYAKLEEMGRAVRLAGYVADTAEVFFDVCEEEKEDLVYRHSEKLAIAFGLIRSTAGAVIRVVKNLRMCSDCHNAVKLISAVYGRKIVVRDKTRFHHFTASGCSCNDYW